MRGAADAAGGCGQRLAVEAPRGGRVVYALFPLLFRNQCFLRACGAGWFQFCWAVG